MRSEFATVFYILYEGLYIVPVEMIVADRSRAEVTDSAPSDGKKSGNDGKNSRSDGMREETDGKKNCNDGKPAKRRKEELQRRKEQPKRRIVHQTKKASHPYTTLAFCIELLYNTNYW